MVYVFVKLCPCVCVCDDVEVCLCCFEGVFISMFVGVLFVWF